MSFLSRHSSFRRNKASTSATPPNPSETPPRSPSESCLQRSAYVPINVAASVSSGKKSTSNSSTSSPSPSRRLAGSGQLAKANSDFVKVVLRDFPGWPHDQLVSLRGVPSGTRCSSCACVAGALSRAPCGCAFCAACLRHTEPQSVIRCRSHGAKALRTELVEDPYVYTACMDLDARCLWSSDGCNFEGPLVAVHEHNAQCLFREETCPDCDKRVSCRAMPSHRSATCLQRKVVCQMCGQHVLASTLERHISVCPDVEILCQLCGRNDIKRGQSEAHRIECTSLERPCRLHVFGCVEKATSMQLRDHETMDGHLDLIAAHTNRQEQRLRKLEESHLGPGSERMADRVTAVRGGDSRETTDSTTTLNNELSKSVEMLRTQVLQLSNRLKLLSSALVEDPFFWNLCPFRSILDVVSDGAQVLYSDSFYTPNIPGYKMRLRLLVNHRDRLLHLTPQLLPGAFNNIMPWPFPSQYLLRLVDQSGRCLHKDLPVTTGAVGKIDKPSESGRVLRSPNLQVKFDELDPDGCLKSSSTGGAMAGAVFSKNDCIVFMFKMNLPVDFVERM